MNDSDSSNNHTTETPEEPSAPHRQPSNWQFSTLLRQVRENRDFSTEEASQCLPGISAQRFEDWEAGRQVPLNTIQTFVIWKLNTSPKPRPRPAPNKHSDSGSILVAGLPAAAFATTAVATLIYHFSQPEAPETLAGYIAASAPGRFLEKVSPESYEDYAASLKTTLLTQFDSNARAKIFAEHAMTAEALLVE